LDTFLGHDNSPQPSVQASPASAQVPPASIQASPAFSDEMAAAQSEMLEDLRRSIPESKKPSATRSLNSGLEEAASQTKPVKRKADDISKASPDEDASAPACEQVQSSEQEPANPVQAAPEPIQAQESTQPRMASGSNLPRPPKRLRRGTEHFGHASEAFSYAAKAFGYAAIGGVAVMSALIATAPAL